MQSGSFEEPLRSVQTNGFCVIDGCIPSSTMTALSTAYDRAVVNASLENTHQGRSSTRVNGLLHADPVFGSLYENEILHAVSRMVIDGPFKLSCLHARSLHPRCEMGEFHIDFRADEEPFPLVSFIYMIDEFTESNGATRFVAGSHHRKNGPTASDEAKCREQSVPACGPPGSVIIFDGRVWHGHGANSNSVPRRSVQGSFIPAAETSATEFNIPIFDPKST
jgi:hypothetical protein